MTREEMLNECVNRDKAIVQLNHLKSDWDDDWNVAICKCIDTIKKLPSVTPQQNKWIPVSERLPEDNTLVLVTVKVGNREPKVRSGYYYMDGHFHIDNGDSWEARDKELIAWMPLPQPYKTEGSE